VVFITFGHKNATHLQHFPLPRTCALISTIANINGERPWLVRSRTKILCFLVP
jgi:hypothetical protein